MVNPVGQRVVQGITPFKTVNTSAKAEQTVHTEQPVQPVQTVQTVEAMQSVQDVQATQLWVAAQHGYVDQVSEYIGQIQEGLDVAAAIVQLGGCDKASKRAITHHFCSAHDAVSRALHVAAANDHCNATHVLLKSTAHARFGQYHSIAALDEVSHQHASVAPTTTH